MTTNSPNVPWQTVFANEPNPQAAAHTTPTPDTHAGDPISAQQWHNIVMQQAAASTQLHPAESPTHPPGPPDEWFHLDDDHPEPEEDEEYDQITLAEVEQQIKENKVTKIEPQLLKGDDTRYDSSSDAHMRLQGTIIRFEGQPYFVREVLPDMTFRAWNMVDKTPDVILHANDIRLDIASLRCGYIEADKKEGSWYPMRHPARQQKQGIEPSRMSYFDPKVSDFRSGFGATASLLKNFRKMLLDDYPEFEQSVAEGRPISKSWSFTTTKDPSVRLIYHKTTPVAFFFPQELRFMFRKGGLTRFRHDSLQKVLAKKGDFSAQYHIEESFGSRSTLG